jgi:DNA-binding IclR family transcriptional regulator
VLLRHPHEKRYSLGPRLVAIGDAARRGYTAVDFVPSVLERLAGRTRHWARAWRMTGDRVVSVAQAGTPRGHDPAAVVRLPVVPPVGTLFMAWSDSPTIEAWLARSVAVDAVRAAFEALPAVRDQGFGVMLGSPEWRALSEPPAGWGRAAGDGDQDAQRALLLVVARQSLLVAELDDARTYPPAEICAPVFGSTGRVELVISLSLSRLAETKPETEATGAELRALGRQVVAAADEVTVAVRGRRPPPTSSI